MKTLTRSSKNHLENLRLTNLIMKLCYLVLAAKDIFLLTKQSKEFFTQCSIRLTR